MLLKSLQLKNVRSYDSLDLKFREGSTLLSGDIGSGKTTILLAVEFALFGIIRGTISGGALLRHGKNNGEITLEFEVDNKKVKVNRTLKKNSTGITQDAGYIEINGVRTDGTAIELKSKILGLLGYPEELLSKSKSLIFRYTVYTPQEEMKQILFESKEDRLEKLRKIFDIDKYKRIKENASNYAKNLRSEIRADSVLIEGLDSLKESLKKLDEELKEKKELLSEANKKITESKEKEIKLKKALEEIEKSQKQTQELKNQLKLAIQEKESNERLKKNFEDEIKSINKELETPLKEEELPKARPLEDINKEITETKKKLDEIDEKVTKIKNDLAIIKSRKSDSQKLTSEISHLENCPTCKQKVTDEHKKLVEEAEKKKINDLLEKEEKRNKFLKSAELVKESKTKSLEKLREEKSNFELIEQKRKTQENEKKRFQSLKEKKENIQEKISKTKTKESELIEKENAIKESISLMSIDEEEAKKAKKDYEQATLSTRNFEIKKAESEQILKNSEKEEERIKKEIQNKETIKKSLEKKKETQNWISNQFVKVVDVIEKHVLVSIYQEFNQRFQEWFNILMDDESISASLDDSFSPIIIQNGYENDISNLSGGEKTSVALAFRLALNKVINDFITTIKTRDIIILDEPTDGFSTEQLDKVRDVLEELNAKQTIIVSHEPKMESFVENVIRIRKHEHLSEIL